MLIFFELKLGKLKETQRAHGQNRELTHANREDTHTSIEHIRKKRRHTPTQ